MVSYIFQGILQGLTEFLPVSSSGHLTLFQYFSGMKDLEANMLTDVALHAVPPGGHFLFRADLLPTSPRPAGKIRREEESRFS